MAGVFEKHFGKNSPESFRNWKKKQKSQKFEHDDVIEPNNDVITSESKLLNDFGDKKPSRKIWYF